MFLKRKHKITVKELSDIELLTLYFEEHNQKHLAELFNRYSHLIFLISKKYLGDSDSAQDITMDIYEKLIKKLKTQKVENFKSWIYSVTKNECLMLIRKKDALDKINQIFNIDVMESGDFLNLQDEEIFSSSLVNEKIEELDKEQKDCLKHFYFDKYSYKEISKITKLTEKKVKSCLQNGKRNLKIALLKTVEVG